MGRIFIDCTAISRKTKITGISRVALEYLRAGYAFGQTHRMTVVPVAVTKQGMIDVRHKLPDWCRSCADFDPSLHLKDRRRLYRAARIRRVLRIVAGAGGIALAGLAGLAKGRIKPNYAFDKVRLLIETERDTSQLALSIEPRPGDVLFMPAWWHDNHPSAFEKLLHEKMLVVPLVHDALPIIMPEHYDASEWFRDYFLTTISIASHVMYVSKQSRQDVEDILNENKSRIPESSIAYNGYNFSHEGKTRAVRDSIKSLFAEGRFNVLMVGSLEPKKNYELVLETCKKLWWSGARFNLIICGREAWKAKELVKALSGHPHRDIHLYWFNDATDAELQFAYANADLSLSASLGEGFGLPVVEALAHKLPILISDIPVYREIAGPAAAYFDPTSPDALAAALSEAIDRPDTLRDLRAKAEGFRWQSWQDCGEAVFHKLKSLQDAFGQQTLDAESRIAPAPGILYAATPISAPASPKSAAASAGAC